MSRIPVPFRRLLTPVVLAGALLGSACGSSDGDLGPDSRLEQSLVTNFTDTVVLPTYQRLATRLTELDASVQALRNEPTQAKLDAARAAWFAARVPWEQSEGFLFGPVDSERYDPALDSWPVNRTDLDAVLASGDVLTPSYVRNLQETQKGFHTAEYLLFGDGGTKVPADFAPRQFEYLTAITAELKAVGDALAGAWTQTKDGKPPYRETLTTAGQAGNAAYPSLQSAAQEMVGGIINILDEVANGKIAAPYDAKDPDLVESQFAYNSLSDFTNNMRSVENVYLGHLSDTQAQGQTLRDVVGVDSELDVKVRAELAASIQALAAIPEPFRESIRAPAAAQRIEAAQAAINTLKRTFESQVLPLVNR
ncbi:MULTISPECIES: imelysin family protein [Myxococcus]|uniref:Peptidase M75 n=1 Tax=Myxococcus xanthus TaxID=34 RepID=A0AAE6FYW7_MYXXA|nr:MULTISPECIES: imelysin family protein [Myxococcus]QDE67772.1 peptidase M75 [Myxococcus xanthus]QDE75049.1 peptidase M75 [Myxococcus xanthus]QDE96620.1 peptidase M75 [Myxococcus xanthus]WAM29072.1 peptidase M75 [Myxococcus sp. NMCA1]